MYVIGLFTALLKNPPEDLIEVFKVNSKVTVSNRTPIHRVANMFANQHGTATNEEEEASVYMHRGSYAVITIARINATG